MRQLSTDIPSFSQNGGEKLWKTCLKTGDFDRFCGKLLLEKKKQDI